MKSYGSTALPADIDRRQNNTGAVFFPLRYCVFPDPCLSSVQVLPVLRGVLSALLFVFGGVRLIVVHVVVLRFGRPVFVGIDGVGIVLHGKGFLYGLRFGCSPERVNYIPVLTEKRESQSEQQAQKIVFRDLSVLEETESVSDAVEISRHKVNFAVRIPVLVCLV